MSTAERNLEMARLYHEEEYALREIGELYGISRQRVHQIVSKVAPGRRGHWRGRRRQQRKIELREAHGRIMRGESKVEDEVQRLGYRNRHSLLVTFRAHGLNVRERRQAWDT